MLDELTQLIPSAVVRELPADAVYVYAANQTQADVLGFVVSVYVPHGQPRPLLCLSHGIQRHDYINHEYVCVVCKQKGTS